MVYCGIFLYDPRGQNDPRNRALDDQLDRLRIESISGSGINVGHPIRFRRFISQVE